MKFLRGFIEINELTNKAFRNTLSTYLSTYVSGLTMTLFLFFFSKVIPCKGRLFCTSIRKVLLRYSVLNEDEEPIHQGTFDLYQKEAKAIISGEASAFSTWKNRWVTQKC